MGNVVITVSGKGGVGKTSISAAIVRQLVQDHPKSLLYLNTSDATYFYEISLTKAAQA